MAKKSERRIRKKVRKIENLLNEIAFELMKNSPEKIKASVNLDDWIEHVTQSIKSGIRLHSNPDQVDDLVETVLKKAFGPDAQVKHITTIGGDERLYPKNKDLMSIPKGFIKISEDDKTNILTDASRLDNTLQDKQGCLNALQQILSDNVFVKVVKRHMPCCNLDLMLVQVIEQGKEYHHVPRYRIYHQFNFWKDNNINNG